MAFTYENLKTGLRALFGANEDDSGTAKQAVGQLMSKWIHYEFARGSKAPSGWNGQTGSLSLSQPIIERVVFVADRQWTVMDAYYCQHPGTVGAASATVSNTDQWNLILVRRGPNDGTLSGTWSVTAYVGGLSSSTAVSTAAPSHSQSILRNNVQNAPNRLLLPAANVSTKRVLKRGDVLTARVSKAGTGAMFKGGHLRILLEGT